MTATAAKEPFVFTPGSMSAAAPGTDSLVDETRREIAEIVREIAAAARSDRSTEQFLKLLVDRILRAMAAEGVLVWQQSDDQRSPLKCVRRLGRITDESIPGESLATHARLLIEVAQDGQPVVVPPTPGAVDGQTAANPTEVPVALVPLQGDESEQSAEYLLEVFLEPGCGIATQRGYLRFVAQMADLAGEFLRADKLRRLRRERQRAREVDEVIAELHGLGSQRKVEALTVDAVVSLFGFDRVGLCQMDRQANLIAVSHVNLIDAKSPAAQDLIRLASVDLDADLVRWWDLNIDENVDGEDRLVPRVVIAAASSHGFRLIGMQSPAAGPVSQECQSELQRLLKHASLALENTARLESIPGGRFLASLAPAFSKSSGWRSLALPIVVGVLLIAAALFPVPLVVYSPALLRPAMVHALSAPRDCVVDQIHVQHGQAVSRGEPLITLTDDALEEEITSLLGDRAVLIQKRSRLMSELVDNSSTRLDQFEQVQGEQSLVSEQIRSLDEQLAVLQRVKRALVIRAREDGIVDAWQITARLASRPVKRGETLAHVIADQSPWVVDVRVPQSRIAHVQEAAEQGYLSASVALDAAPNELFDATLEQVGPAVTKDQDAIASTAVLLRLNDQMPAQIASNQSLRHQSGAPARVMFRCGKAPAGYLVLQDLIGSLRGTWALYFAGGSSRQTDHGKTSS